MIKGVQGYQIRPSPCAIVPFAKQPFEVFFGPEHEKSAGLIHHVDCGQLIHAESIVEEAVEKNVVGLPECPRCKTQIRKTVRFNSQILRRLRW